MAKKGWNSAAARRLCEMAGVSDVKEAIPTVVGRLLSGLACPPTDLIGLCTRLNVTGIDEDENLPVVGELRRDGDGFRIFCASDQSHVRRRFTIAHELAHAVIESTGPRAPRIGSELERVCDLLAAEILMPAKAFGSALGNRPASGSTIRELSSRFQTSLSATAIRCSELRPISVLEIQGGQVRWAHGPARLSRYQLDDVLRQTFEGAPGDGLVFIDDGGCGRAFGTEWLRVSENRSGLLVMTPQRIR
jgi:hypothetical protein